MTLWGKESHRLEGRRKRPTMRFDTKEEVMRRSIAAMFALASSVLYFIACGSDTPTAPSAAQLPAASTTINAPPLSGHASHSASAASHTTATLDADVHQQMAQLREFLAPF